jgi:hypothetical protein
MNQFLWTFEHSIAGLHSLQLLVLAVFSIAAGLFAWLGGLGFRKVALGLIGAFCGAACAFFFAGYNLLLIAALTGAGVLLALTFYDSFLVVMTSIFAAVYGYTTLVKPYVSTSGELIAIIRDFTVGVPYYNWPILLLIIIAPFAIKSTWWQGTSAVLYSASGVIMLMAGVIMLLVRSNLSSVGHINDKYEIYLGLFIAVIALGSVMQLFVLPRLSTRIASAASAMKTRAKRTKKNKASDSESSSTHKNATWRTA